MNVFLKIVAAGILLAAALFANDIRNITEEKIETIFSGDVEVNMSKVKIPAELKSEIERKTRQEFFADELYIWKITKGKNLKGYAVLDNVYGKSLPITFLVIFDKDYNILSSSVIKYREPYGGGVTNKNWQKQFEGKNFKSSFEVGNEINGISGATISVKSVSAGIRKIALLIPKIAENL